jgi:hypothetical protein
MQIRTQLVVVVVVSYAYQACYEACNCNWPGDWQSHDQLAGLILVLCVHNVIGLLVP